MASLFRCGLVGTEFANRSLGRAEVVEDGRLIHRIEKDPTMQSCYQARRVSKQRLEALRKSREIAKSIVIDSMSGFLLIEPIGSNLGDGEMLQPSEADFELHPAWCLVPQSRLNDARKRLGLEVESGAGVPVATS
jgi:hypothetical protein